VQTQIWTLPLSLLRAAGGGRRAQMPLIKSKDEKNAKQGRKSASD
jgi:hypothetical protein